MPILGQQVLNLQSSLTAMISTGFEKQQQYTQQLKSKLDDFLEDRIAFQMTLVGIAQHGISSDIPGDVNRVRSGGLNTIKPA
ncbi:hypothetical protein E4U16_007148, partial [Claviceps sp. LM84 group G4]